jgi:hypothetical protein
MSKKEIKIKLREPCGILQKLQWKMVSYQGKLFYCYCYRTPKADDALTEINRTLTLSPSYYSYRNHDQFTALEDFGLSEDSMKKIEIAYLRHLL